MQPCPGSLRSGFWPGLAWVLPPKTPQMRWGSLEKCLESMLVLSGSTGPEAGLCRGPSPQPDFFPSSSRHPARVGLCILSAEMPLSKGIDGCWSTQPEMKDVWVPVTSQPRTGEPGLLSSPVRRRHPAGARGSDAIARRGL